MEDDFDINAAVGDIGEGLGFEVTDAKAEPDDVALEVDQKQVEEAKAAPEPAAKEEPATPGEEPGAALPEATADTPPKTWRKEAAATWAALPSEAKNEIIKREADIFKGLETYKVDAGFGKSVKQVVAPYEAILRQNNLDPVQTIQGLMSAHHRLATGSPQQKVELFKILARDYQIDLTSLGGAAEDAPYLDPQVKALQDELAGVKSQLSATAQRQQQEAAAAISKQVDAFAADPKNIYFNDVADIAADLVNRGLAGTLQEAYDKAIWLHPEVRAKETARVASETAAKAAAEAKVRAEAARKATAANVKTSAKSGSAATPLGSLDDTLETSLKAIKARG